MKVYICVDAEFPRGNASANYVEYLGKAIKERNIAVSILGITQKEENQWFNYQGMKCVNIYYPVGNKMETLKSRIHIGRRLVNMLAKQSIVQEDVIICYSENYFLLHYVWSFAKRKKIKVINCVVEWHTVDQFKYGYLDVFNYWYYRMAFAFGIGISGNVIAISRNLERHFKRKKCNVLRLPILADPFQFPYREEKPRDKIRIIYSGVFQKKDAMDIMLKAFQKLTDKELMQVEFHITGSTRRQLEGVVDFTKDDWKRLENSIFIHEWIGYEELVDLLGNMHFGLIAKKLSKVTESNFPSKVPEMMCYGIIPIITNVGDCPTMYLEDGKDSILFEHCTVEACRCALKRAIMIPETDRQYMQKAARKKVETLFYYKLWSGRIVDFLNSNNS